MGRKLIPLFVRKRGGAAPAVAAIAGSAVIPVAKQLAIKAAPYAKKAIIKAAPYVIPAIGRKIRKKMGVKKGKKSKKAERIIIGQIQNGLPIVNDVRKRAYNRRKLTQSIINSL